MAGGKIKFGIDDNGNYGYIKDGADTVTPFKSGDGIPPIKSIQYVLYGSTTFKIYITFDVTNYKSMKLNGTVIDLSNLTEYKYVVIENNGSATASTIENPVTDVT